MGFRARIMFSIFALFAVSIGVLVLANMHQVFEIVTEEHAKITRSKLGVLKLQIDNHYEKLRKSGLEELYSKGYKNLKIKELEEQYNRVESSDHLVIFNSKGVDLINSLTLSREKIEILDKKGGTLNYLLEGKEWILVYEYFAPWQWYVGFTVAKSDKMAAVNTYIKKLTLMLIIYMFVFLIVLYLLLQLITSPLKKFSQEVSRMRLDGNYSSLKFGNKDELEQLSNAFNKLVEQQAHYAEDLKNEVEKQTTTIRDQQVKLLTSANLSALGEMAGAIAHEINNPLAIILASAELIEKDIGKDSNELNIDRLSILAGKISKTVNRISKIIDGLLSIAGESNRSVSEELSVYETVTELLHLCGEKLKYKDIETSILWCEASKDAIYLGRKVQVSQILLNLLNNAIQATENHDRKVIRIESKVTDSFVKIRISNSGDLIPEEIQEKIFQPFFTTKKVGKGTGLGLSISRLMTEEQGGSLILDSESPEVSFILSLKKA